MDISITGFILLYLFILPGAVWHTHKQNYFPTRRLDTTEFLLACFGYGAIANLLALVFVLYFAVSFESYLGLSDLLGAPYSNIQDLELRAFWKFGVVLAAYTLLACFLAFLLSDVQCHLVSRKRALKQRPVWLNFFHPNAINFVRVFMSNGDRYSGQIKLYPHEFESVHSEYRDIVLTNVIAERHDGRIENLNSFIEQGQEASVLLNIRNIESIELIRPSD